MTTVTVFTTAVPQLVATVSVATTETTTAAETTTVTVTLPDASVICTAPASANLLVDGGFDINPSVNWQVDAPANPADGTGEATTWEFLRGQEGAGAISPPNLASSTLEDLVSLQHLLSQSVTGIDTSAQYTLSFWYRAFLLTTNPPPNRLEGDPVDESTICRLRVYWGDQLLFNQGFNEETGSGQPWRNIVLQNIAQPLETADLLFRHSCVPREDLDGYSVLYLDSAAIVPQSDVTCSSA
ncbi:hypothetical protein KJ359_001518 [Pestalotiopsis sp. 9143b]|nr:hypothetical protein KJ359_001518 [Pestalotiopsis sp. 9143b]